MTTQQDKNTPLPNGTQYYQPPLFDKTDEELATTGDIDFTAKETAPAPAVSGSGDGFLQRLLEKEKLLGDSATKPVVFSTPLITRDGVGIIRRDTINIIQGAFGSHKSRLAELFAALMLTTNVNADQQFVGFQRNMMERFCLCYIDTERNLKEELPAAIQGIKLRAGYTLQDKPDEFRFTSIKGEDRKDRFKAIEAFIRYVRDQTILHLFCVIDVVTDAIGDFNDPKESMKLFDFLGNLCDNYNATFLLVIHQNPGTEKARGHTGTEATNKASTALQIGVEKDASGNDTELIRLRYVKLRRAKRPDPLYLMLRYETEGLVLADAASVSALINQRKRKADVEDLADRLASLLSVGRLPKHEVWRTLESEFKTSNATIRTRIKTILDDAPAMYDEEGRSVRLIEEKQGRDQFFSLAIIE